MTWFFAQSQNAEQLRSSLVSIFKSAAASVRLDFGTTWYDPQFACTQTGMSAVPGSAVPGCAIPGLLSAGFIAGA